MDHIKICFLVRIPHNIGSGGHTERDLMLYHQDYPESTKEALLILLMEKQIPNTNHPWCLVFGRDLP
jgi:hypothetical protein